MTKMNMYEHSNYQKMQRKEAAIINRSVIYVARTLLSWSRVVSEMYPTRVSDTHVMYIFKTSSRIRVSYPFHYCRVRAT